MERADLERLDRDTLITRAESIGVVRANVLTRPELIDELLVRSARKKDDPALGRARGLFGRARDLLARVIERGLHLPDAAERLRNVRPSSPPPPRAAPAAVPTVTLAEIYATQGHKEKALETLRRVLETEPEHAAARTLLAQLEAAELPKPPLPPEGDEDETENDDDEAGDDDGDDPESTASEAAANGVSSADGRDGKKKKKKKKNPRDPAIDSVPAEPLGMLDDAPLPLKYDVDECVVIPVDPRTMFVYWEMRDTTRAHLEKTRPGGTIFLRVLVIEPSWDGPRAQTRDHEVYNALGDWFVRDLPPGCVVRAALGWSTGQGVFVPVAQSPALEAHPSQPSPEVAEVLVRWTVRGAVPVSYEDGDAQGILRALDRVGEADVVGRPGNAAAASRRRLGIEGRGVAGGPPPVGAGPFLGASERLAAGVGPGGRLGGASEQLVSR